MTNPLITRFENEVALVDRAGGPRVTTALNAVWGELQARREKAGSSDDDADFWDEDRWYAAYRPYRVDASGVLQIPVAGVLLSGFPYQFYDWATGYEYIQAAYERGIDDPQVQGIAFIIDSPGGDVRGNFDLVDFLYAGRGRKPTIAIAAECACSAAYSIASACDTISMTRTAIVGSIGVVTSHFDVSEAMKKAGYKLTFIYAGAHKVDGNSYEPLPDDVKARIQGRVDQLYDIFVEIVSRNRSIESQAVRDTQALTFTSVDAVKIGLVDKVDPLVDSLAAFAAQISNKGTSNMTTAKDEAAKITAEDVTAARTEAKAEGVTEGKIEGAKAERARIQAIVTSDEAKGREATANHLAFKTDMSAADAVAMLATVPLPTKPDTSASTETNHFAAAMDAAEHPNLGAGDEASAAKPSAASTILADYRAASGDRVKK